MVAIREGLSGYPITAVRQETGTPLRRFGITLLSTAFYASTRGGVGSYSGSLR